MMDIDLFYDEYDDFDHTIIGMSDFCYREKKKYELTYNDYEIWCWYERGNSLSGLRRNEEAIDAYKAAIDLEPDYRKIWKVIGLEPDSSEAWNNLGYSLFVLGRDKEAVEAIDSACFLYGNDHYTSWLSCGNFLSDLGKYEVAIDAYERAIEVAHHESDDEYDSPDDDDDDYYSALLNRDSSLSELETNREAIEFCGKVIEIKPDLHQAWYNRGISLYALGRYEEAIDSYEKAIEIKSDDYFAWSNRGISLYALGRNEEAIDSYEKAIEFKPDYHAAWYNRGISLDALGRREEAIDSYEKAIEFKPDKYEAWDNRGYALFCLKRYQDAIDSYNKAIEFNPDYANAFYNRACCYGFMGNLALALEDLTIAFRLDPEGYRQLATTDRDLDPLRKLPDFIALMDNGIH